MVSWKSSSLRHRLPAAALLCAGLGAVFLSQALPDSGAPPLRVRAHGRDFRWHFTLPGPDNRFDTGDDRHTTGWLTLPHGRTVTVELTSEDYLYAFRAPSLGLLEMAMPGMTLQTRFVANQAGRHELTMDPACAVPLAYASKTMGWLEIGTAPRD